MKIVNKERGVPTIAAGETVIGGAYKRPERSELYIRIAPMPGSSTVVRFVNLATGEIWTPGSRMDGVIGVAAHVVEEK